MKKKILLILVIIFCAMQFIRPEKNLGNAYTPADITHTISLPAEVKNILETSCYDCHSNKSYYPWYFNIQPVGLWMDHHIDEGKHELNFSEFDSYKLKRKLHKLEEIVEQIENGEMPMSSYLITHKEARLTEKQKTILIEWAKESRELISN